MLQVKKVLVLSFSGCGFLGMFHIGSLAAFKDATNVVRIDRCFGASSGSVVACAAVANMDLEWLQSVFREILASVGHNRFGAFSKNFDIGVILKNVFEDLPPDLYLRVNDKLFVSLTSSTFQNVTVSKFKSNEELRDVLHCSCFLPAFSGRKIPKFKGLRYLDGGLTNQQPTFDSATIKISPFSGKYKDICPSETSRANITLANENMYINFNNFIRGKHAISHLDDKTLSYYYQLGYNITKKFLENNQN